MLVGGGARRHPNAHVAHFGDQLLRRAIRIKNYWLNFSDFRIESSAGTFAGKVDQIGLGQIWVADDAIKFTVTADGSTRFDAKLPD